MAPMPPSSGARACVLRVASALAPHVINLFCEKAVDELRQLRETAMEAKTIPSELPTLARDVRLRLLPLLAKQLDLGTRPPVRRAATAALAGLADACGALPD